MVSSAQDTNSASIVSLKVPDKEELKSIRRASDSRVSQSSGSLVATSQREDGNARHTLRAHSDQRRSKSLSSINFQLEIPLDEEIWKSASARGRQRWRLLADKAMAPFARGERDLWSSFENKDSQAEIVEITEVIVSEIESESADLKRRKSQWLHGRSMNDILKRKSVAACPRTFSPIRQSNLKGDLYDDTLKSMSEPESEPDRRRNKSPFHRLHKDYAVHKARLARQRAEEIRWQEQQFIDATNAVLNRTRFWKDSDLNPFGTGDRLHAEHLAKKRNLELLRQQKEEESEVDAKRQLNNFKEFKEKRKSRQSFVSNCIEHNDQPGYIKLFYNAVTQKQKWEEARKEKREEVLRDFQAGIKWGRNVRGRKSHIRIQKDHCKKLHGEYAKKIQKRIQQAQDIHSKHQEKIKTEKQNLLNLTKNRLCGPTAADAPGNADSTHGDTPRESLKENQYEEPVVNASTQMNAFKNKMMQRSSRFHQEDNHQEYESRPAFGNLGGQLKRSMMLHNPMQSHDSEYSALDSAEETEDAEDDEEDGESVVEHDDRPYWQRGTKDYDLSLQRRQQLRMKALDKEKQEIEARRLEVLDRTSGEHCRVMAASSRARARALEEEAERRVHASMKTIDREMKSKHENQLNQFVPGLKALAYISAALTHRFGIYIPVAVLEELRPPIAEMIHIQEQAMLDVEAKEFLLLKKIMRVPNFRRMEGLLRTVKEVAMARREPEPVRHTTFDFDDLMYLAKVLHKKLKTQIGEGKDWAEGTSVETSFCRACKAYDPGLKQKARAITKAEVRFGHRDKSDRCQLNFDLVRFSLEYDTCENLLHGLQEIKKTFHVLDARNGFKKPSAVGTHCFEILCSQEVERDTLVFEVRLELSRLVQARKQSKAAYSNVMDRLKDILAKSTEGVTPYCEASADNVACISYLVHDVLFGPPEVLRLRYFKRNLEHRWGTIVSAWRRAFGGGATADFQKFLSICNTLKFFDLATTIWDGFTQGCGVTITLWDLDPVSMQKLLRLKAFLLKDTTPPRAFKKLTEDGHSVWNGGLTLAEFSRAMKHRRYADDASESFFLLEKYGGTRGDSYVRLEDMFWLNNLTEIARILDTKPLLLSTPPQSPVNGKKDVAHLPDAPAETDPDADAKAKADAKAALVRDHSTPESLKHFLKEHGLLHMYPRLREIGAKCKADLAEVKLLEDEELKHELVGGKVTIADATKLVKILEDEPSSDDGSEEKGEEKDTPKEGLSTEALDKADLQRQDVPASNQKRKTQTVYTVSDSETNSSDEDEPAPAFGSKFQSAEAPAAPKGGLGRGRGGPFKQETSTMSFGTQSSKGGKKGGAGARKGKGRG
eukprot:gnl/MRDRNA2_/MRDRNA2_112171_c0_seq1.p1 gnl/MRDRNA2_/MRDRNA2_112171_c0~~gnl/MRDRNA2_/MRDRNA2_112171_c0_seq1.p1  ORF type:complete len:1338 (+),score=312.28 gnl/MRDRNA2_/MRDRNA2_112171_c0_seq1:131-4144(+)